MSEEIEKRVLALKYRPRRFEDLVGQGTVSQTLSLALDAQRLSHAYLFSGLRGSGKTSTARIMAKALLCSNGPTSKPCEVCENCKSANTSRHLDIIEMDAASNRGIDDIKDLIEHTKYKPSSAKFKVFIIDEVHMLTTQAFNALLKTLEEPPDFVKFILATTDPLKLPATILSRTQHFRFNKIASVDVIHHLSYILNTENIEYEKEALEILARSGQGSLRDTLTLLDQAIIFSKGKITTVSVVDMLGLIDPELMDNIFNTVLNKGDINPIIKKLDSYEVGQICDEMTIYLKDKMINKDPKFDLFLFDRFFRILSDAKHLLVINSDGGFVLILTLLKLMEATNIKTIDDIINQVEQIPIKEVAKPQQMPNVNLQTQQVSDVKKVEEKISSENIPLSKDENTIELNGIDTIETVKPVFEENDFSTPFDEGVSTQEVKEEVKESIKADIQEEVVEKQVKVDLNTEVEVVPVEQIQEDPSLEVYEKLTAKIYDRDYSLGECFEKNFIYKSFENNKLTIISYAQDEDRKFLFKHFGVIKTFIYDTFGASIEIDFQKEEPSILEENKVQKELKEDNSSDSGSMIEDIEVGSGCVANMSKTVSPSMSQKELQINDVLNSKMLNKAKELFYVKKITVKTRN